MKVHDGRFVLSNKPPEGCGSEEWEQLKYSCSLTFRQRLEWLEEVTSFALKMKEAKVTPLSESE